MKISPFALLGVLVCLCISNKNLIAQCTTLHPEIEEQFAKSELVVEGKVIATESFYDKEAAFIYTKNLITVHKAFKGIPKSETITLITLGGTIDDEAIVFSGALKLDIGASGVFFLRQYAGHRIASETSLFYRPLAEQDSYISYRPDWKEAYSYGQVYYKLESLYEKLERLGGSSFIELQEATLNVIRNPGMHVSEISPSIANAGAEDTIYIHGEGFGDIPGTIFYSNADNGGFGYTSTFPWHIISWSDSVLVSRVPHKAGTGDMIILGSNSIAFSQHELDVQYAHTNVLSSHVFHQPQLVDEGDDENGGYLFRISDNAENSGVPIMEEEGAYEAILRAVNTWRDSSAAPLYFSRDCPFTELQMPGGLDDDINLITFDNDVWDLDIEVSPYTLAVTISRYIRCSGTDWEVSDIDIILRRDGNPNGIGGSITWNFSETEPHEGALDFQTVVLHELGHALQLQHVVDPEAVMHYSTTFGEAKRNLGELDDEAGADYVLGHSFSYEPPQLNCWPTSHFSTDRTLHPYDENNVCKPDTSLAEGFYQATDDDHHHKIIAYPNPVKKGEQLLIEYINVTEREILIELFSVQGQALLSEKVHSHSGSNKIKVVLPLLDAGLYLLKLDDGAEIYRQKIVYQ